MSSTLLRPQLMHNSISHLFPLDRCPCCSYILTGLPAPPRCPECGHAPGPDALILFGHPYTYFQNPAAAALFFVGIVCSLFLYVDSALGLGVLLVSFLNGRPADLLFPLLLSFGYAAIATGLLLLTLAWRRRITRHMTNPDPLALPSHQVVLCPAGYASRRGFGPVYLLSWIPELEVDLTDDGPIARLRIMRLTPGGNTDWSTAVDIAFPASPEQRHALLTHIHTLRLQALVPAP